MGEFKVQFVGLAYFLSEPAQRHALFPDGRAVPAVVEHIATIAIAADDLAAIDSFSGWDPAAILRTSVPAAINGSGADQELLQFVLSGDSIEIEGVSRAVRGEPLDTSQHDSKLQPLTQGTRIVISPATAKTVADVQIQHGSLHAFRYPGSDNDGTGAIISELRVPFAPDTVTITVQPKGNGSSSPAAGVRTVVVKNGSEIALVNASRPHHAAMEDDTQHFAIYNQLDPGLAVGMPRATPIDFPESQSRHLLFFTPGAIGSSVKCNNTCC